MIKSLFNDPGQISMTIWLLKNQINFQNIHSQIIGMAIAIHGTIEHIQIVSMTKK